MLRSTSKSNLQLLTICITDYYTVKKPSTNIEIQEHSICGCCNKEEETGDDILHNEVHARRCNAKMREPVEVVYI